MDKSSRLSGFYKQSVEERAGIVSEWASLSPEEALALSGEQGLTPELADKLIENVVGVFGLPLGIAANFMVNGKDVLVPMVVEEPSVVAGASFMAKLARTGGGFKASSTEPIMVGQVQILDLNNLATAEEKILSAKEELLAIAADTNKFIVDLGGGPLDIEVRRFEETPVGPMLVMHLLFDCRDAMGANMINTACEALTDPLENLTGGRVGLRILSNLADRRTTKAECTVPESALETEEYSGEQVVNGIVEAWAFASVDPYRATTHNKGIMNGIDPIVIATGNDWRAVEAGAHAYASRSGTYTSLSTWDKDSEGNLHGSLELPMALGIVGGSTRVHPTTRAALKILNVKTAQELAQIVVSVGLAQNMAALRALATEGIQRGHMALHARQIAIAAGAKDDQIQRLTQQMIKAKRISLDYAEELLQQS